MTEHHSLNTDKAFAVWMDYQKAMIYRFEKAPVLLKTIVSDVQALPRTTGGKASFDPHFSRSISFHKRLEEHRRQKLKRFFKEIIGFIPEGSEVFLVGPGLAKSNFKNFLEEHYKHHCVCAEAFAVDYMSDAEIVAYLKCLYRNLSQVDHPTSSGMVTDDRYT